ncbi:MAG TPA: PAS domain S-box protein, partial [Pseudoduganella sp.]
MSGYPGSVRPSIFVRLLPRRRLGSWLALWLALSVLLSTTVLVVVLGHLAAVELRSAVGAGLAARARYAAQQLDATMYERYREVELLASRGDFGSAAVPLTAKRGIVEHLQGSYPLYAWIGLAGRDGKVMAATGGMLEGADVAKRPWFGGALAGRHVQDVHDARLLANLLPREEGGPPRFVDVAFPVKDTAGRIQGVLGAHLNWRWAEQVRLQLDAAGGNDAETLIVDRDGKVLAGPAGLTGTAVPPAILAMARSVNRRHVEAQWLDGRAYLVGGAATHGHGSYPGMGWIVLTRQDTRTAYAQVNSLQVRAMLVGLAVALAFSLVGWRVSRRITRPLQKAAALAAAIEGGAGHSISVPRGSFEELAVLTGAVNTSLSRLKEHERQLTVANADLEQRVAQRTRDVAQSLDSVRRNEARIRAILETAHDAFIGMDSAGCITDWNPRAEQLFGWTCGEVTGRAMEDVVAPVALRAAHRAGLERFLAGGAARVLGRRVELMALRRDGSEFPVEINFGEYWSDGQRFFAGFMTDITERVRDQEALQFQTTLLQAQSNVAIDGILVSHQGRVLNMNRRYAEIFNVPEELRPPERCVEMFAWATRQAADPDGYRRTIEGLREDFKTVHRDEVLLADGRVLDR